MVTETTCIYRKVLINVKTHNTKSYTRKWLYGVDKPWRENKNWVRQKNL